MAYSIPGLLALLVIFLVNFDVFKSNKGKAFMYAQNSYRMFLLGAASYLVCDALWGFLDDAHNLVGLQIDTTVYFIAMGLSVYLWARYTADYLRQNNGLAKALKIAGLILFLIHIAFVIVNAFYPIMFSFDDNAKYQAELGRNIVLILQAILFFITFIYTTLRWFKTDGALKDRYFAIMIYGGSMTALVVVQYFYPLWPLYSIGYLVGTCLLHTFVVEARKEEQTQLLEQAVKETENKQKELENAMKLAFTDALTGAKSKHAYVEAEIEFDYRIGNGEQDEFAIVVFDLNELKEVNDTYGHEAGDKYIISAVELIKSIYKRSPLFRIGGDEFIVILEGEDYRKRASLIKLFDDAILKNLVAGKVVVASGMAEYDKKVDFSLKSITNRADKYMYERKRKLKESSGRISPKIFS